METGVQFPVAQARPMIAEFFGLGAGNSAHAPPFRPGLNVPVAQVRPKSWIFFRDAFFATRKQNSAPRSCGGVEGTGPFARCGVGQVESPVAFLGRYKSSSETFFLILGSHLKKSPQKAHTLPARARTPVCRVARDDFPRVMVTKRCHHGKRKDNCVVCVGGPHGKLKRNCAACSRCPHGRVKHNCVECVPCPHGKVRGSCAECIPCPHDNRKVSCKKCNACLHGKLKHGCVVCSPCPHGKLKNSCAVCNRCHHGKQKDLCAECKPCPHGKRKL